MLEQVMRYINNRFDCDGNGVPYGSQSGQFSVEDGTLEVEGLLEGQWFWVEGSVLNDGLHQYPAEGMSDEEFDGKVVFLVVPKAVEEIAQEIEEWQTRNADVISSPLQSESFGGYSYTRASGGSQGNETPSAAWQLQFGARLRPWRKLSRDWV